MSYINPLAVVKSNKIGKDTKIWQFVVILKKAEIGDNCNINCHCFIENDVIIGNNVTIKSGVYLWDGLRIGDDVFIGPNVTFTNDLLPRSKQYPDEFVKTLVHQGASLGANSTIISGIEIGKYAMIGAGSVVTKDISDYTLVYGNPAQHHGYVCQCGNKLSELMVCEVCNKTYKIVDGTVIIND